ncbi:MAG: class I tRNA ligase family protein, partial [Candidatus Promineifilaceae bacterium]
MFTTQNLYQNDEKWKNTKLGNSNETIGGWGCLLTSATMMLNGMGYSETPETVNEKMKANSGFQGAFFIPSVLPYIFPNVVYKDMQPCENSPAPVALIDAAVAAGKPVILQVDWNKQAGIQTHFVLVKEKQGDDYVIYDPYKYGGDGPSKDVLLTKRYKYNGGTLEKEISAVLWFDGTISPSQPEPKKVAVPKDAMNLFVIEDNLALRAEPSISGYLWKRMAAGSELTSLENAATTKAKLGQQGKWVQVQDSTGQQGYTAAWYVSDKKDAQPVTPPTTPRPASSSSTSSAPATTPTTASAAKVPVPPGAMELLPTEELAFRTQPVISDSTLIRRLPPTEKLISLEPTDQTIKKVGSDVETFGFNTAISAMMILINHLGKQSVRPKSVVEKLVLILAPFSPHIAEELWQRLGHEDSLAYESWPGYDEVAHHSGPWTTDAFGDLKRLDRTFARLRTVAKEKASRPYDLIIL